MEARQDKQSTQQELCLSLRSCSTREELKSKLEAQIVEIDRLKAVLDLEMKLGRRIKGFGQDLIDKYVAFFRKT